MPGAYRKDIITVGGKFNLEREMFKQIGLLITYIHNFKLK